MGHGTMRSIYRNILIGGALAVSAFGGAGALPTTADAIVPETAGTLHALQIPKNPAKPSPAKKVPAKKTITKKPSGKKATMKAPAKKATMKKSAKKKTPAKKKT